MKHVSPPMLSHSDLRKELHEYGERLPGLGEDELFVLWFLRAFVTEDESIARAALCGGPGDKGVDAVLIDDAARIVFVVQGKYRKTLAARTEHRADVLGFAQSAALLAGDSEVFGGLVEGMSPAVRHRLEEARKRITKRGYSLQLFYVTLGKCSSPLQEEATRTARRAGATVDFHVLDGRRIMVLLADYFDGVAPPVPSLDLEIESGGGHPTAGVLNRLDKKTEIESWVFSMNDAAVAELFDRAGTRLFARNVRGFLGSTEINLGMGTTLAKEPEYFWYYNNGITIICDDATHESSGGRAILRVANPQVINGQQTTRMLAQSAKRGARASVLVRVIRVPRAGIEGASNFETLVSRIVAATNWQNAIRPSDLMSNDRRQIEIERQLRKLNYLYLRKRMTKREAMRRPGVKGMRVVKKEEIAQAVAGCELDPAVLREGKERLFEERWYRHIFPNADPRYYLTRYWLLREVSFAARGYPERAYAKWLVLNFMWGSLPSVCRSRSGADAFRGACEHNRGDGPLVEAIDAVYRESLRLYRRKRGFGPTAADVSTFFKRHNLHKEFSKHWRGSANKSRARFGRSLARFTALLAADLAH